VSGYLTAVPVTDNQHVKAGDVIARIDDRDYRTALDQAEAQVAAAHASIENIDAQLDVQQAQISANQGTGGSGAGRVRVCRAAGSAVRAPRANRLRQPFRTNSNIPRSSTSSRPRSRAHRRP